MRDLWEEGERCASEMGSCGRFVSGMRVLGDRDWLEGVGDDEGERDLGREGRVQILWTLLSHTADGLHRMGQVQAWVRSGFAFGLGLGKT